MKRFTCWIGLGLIITLSCLTAVSYGQPLLVSDTIYYDYNWSICEQPVAEYYRICTLKVTKTINFVGELTDYYIDGSVEMKGNYSDDGKKNGAFAFFNANGTKSREGVFKDDDMVGIWSYYNQRGDLIVQFDCTSAAEFTPLLIVNPKGDTLIKNGNGKVTFNTQKDLPGLFPIAYNYTMSANIIEGKKDGPVKYWINDQRAPDEPFCWETYRKGKFYERKGNGNYGLPIVNRPCNILNLMVESNLGRAENFYHSNLVFGWGEAGDNKVVRLLLLKEIPELVSEAGTYEENSKVIYNIIGEVLKKPLTPTNTPNMQIQAFPSGNKFDLVSFTLPLNSGQTIRSVQSTITLTVDTSGYLSNSTFKGNLNQKEVNAMNYYFSRVGKLIPLYKNGHAVASDLHLKILTLADTIRYQDTSGWFSYRYIVINTDSVSEESLRSRPPYPVSEDYDKIYTKVEQPAEFIGGPMEWRRYLQRNLNLEKAFKDRPANGAYRVVLKFLVDEQGNVSDVQAIEATEGCRSCIIEAVRVIAKGPRWQPAVQNGKAVKFYASQAITFSKDE